MNELAPLSERELLLRLVQELRAVRLDRTGPWRFAFSALIDTTLKENVTMLMLPNDHKVRLALRPQDARGNPAPVDGIPEWTLSDATLAELRVAGDGLSAALVPAGPLGTLQVNVSADAALGAGISTINGILDVEIVAAQATTLGIEAGAPEAQ